MMDRTDKVMDGQMDEWHDVCLGGNMDDVNIDDNWKDEI